MNIAARFIDKRPQTIEDVERLTITIGDFEIEIIAHPVDGKHVLQVRLDEPLGDSLVVFPRASNMLLLCPRRP